MLPQPSHASLSTRSALPIASASGCAGAPTGELGASASPASARMRCSCGSAEFGLCRVRFGNRNGQMVEILLYYYF